MKRSSGAAVLGILTGILAIALAVVVFMGGPEAITGPKATVTPTRGTARTAAADEAASSSVSAYAETASAYARALRVMDTGTRTSYNYYGGDAYSGIQQAGADTARNVKNLANINVEGFADLILTVDAASNRVTEAVAAHALSAEDKQAIGQAGSSARYGFSAVLLVMGLALISLSAARISENKRRDAYETQVLAQLRDL